MAEVEISEKGIRALIISAVLGGFFWVLVIQLLTEVNASLPALLSAVDVKALLEEHNATLPAQIPLGAGVEEIGQSYMSLPAEFQRIEDGQKQTAAAMKACIKEYNATLPAQVKTSGSRDALLEQLALVNPDLVAQEAQKPHPLKVSGTKADLMQSVKSVKPDAVFADELLDAWRDNPEGKVLVTRQQLATALDIQKALHNHPTAGKLLTHPSRPVEVSYFGIDEETGLDIDLTAGEVHVSRNLTQEGIFGPPKTESGYRIIKLLEPALEALRAQKELTGNAPQVPVTIHHREFGKTETQKLHFVFMPRMLKGMQAPHYSVNSIKSLWDVTVRKAGIRRRRPYQLRHTYACWMLSAGANPAFIASQMGHENAEMVFQVYSSWITALDSDQVSFLNQRIGGYTSAP